MPKFVATTTELSKKTDCFTFIRCPKCKTKYIKEQNDGCPDCNALDEK